MRLMFPVPYSAIDDAPAADPKAFEVKTQLRRDCGPGQRLDPAFGLAQPVRVLNPLRRDFPRGKLLRASSPSRTTQPLAGPSDCNSSCRKNPLNFLSLPIPVAKTH
ncbi:MAG: hypothetical protein ACREVY_15580 [Gammaproteobacteria bacterium]